VTFRRKGDEIHGTFRSNEVDVIRALIAEVSEVVAHGPRVDPAVERLFPAVYAENPTEAAELRRYVEDDLRQSKLDAAEVVLETVRRRTILTEEQADAWLRALNDVRLTLGIRLEIHDDFDLEEEYEAASGERVVQLSIYGYLSYLQETLIEAMS
jgi:hypothetical protein